MKQLVRDNQVVNNQVLKMGDIVIMHKKNPKQVSTHYLVTRLLDSKKRDPLNPSETLYTTKLTLIGLNGNAGNRHDDTFYPEGVDTMTMFKNKEFMNEIDSGKDGLQHYDVDYIPAEESRIEVVEI